MVEYSKRWMIFSLCTQVYLNTAHNSRCCTCKDKKKWEFVDWRRHGEIDFCIRTNHCCTAQWRSTTFQLWTSCDLQFLFTDWKKKKIALFFIGNYKIYFSFIFNDIFFTFRLAAGDVLDNRNSNWLLTMEIGRFLSFASETRILPLSFRSIGSLPINAVVDIFHAIDIRRVFFAFCRRFYYFDIQWSVSAA